MSPVIVHPFCRFLRVHSGSCSFQVLSGSVSQTPTLADLDGDGTLEVIAGTSSGDIVVLRGKDGKDMPGFPVRTGDRIISPISVLPFPEDYSNGQAGTGEFPMPRLIVPSFDGRVYFVSSATGCADWVDIGEQTYSMVLIEDLDRNGYLDLLVSTMNGNVFAMQTSAPAQNRTAPFNDAASDFATMLCNVSVVVSKRLRRSGAV